MHHGLPVLYLEHVRAGRLSAAAQLLRPPRIELDEDRRRRTRRIVDRTSSTLALLTCAVPTRKICAGANTDLAQPPGANVTWLQ